MDNKSNRSIKNNREKKGLTMIRLILNDPMLSLISISNNRTRKRQAVADLQLSLLQPARYS